MVVKCLLCLEYPTIPGPKYLEIFGEEGLRLDISAIINKHFWIKTNRNNEDVEKICMTCWEIVRDFHILYQRVEEVHRHLEIRTIELDDPLPQDVLLKSEEDPSTVQDPIKEDNAALFDSEVKVEVHDLDLLPQIEILESEEHNVVEKPVRANRRGRPPAREQSPNVSAKKIKKEQSSNAIDKDENLDDLSESEQLANDALNTSGSLEDINRTLLSTSLDMTDKEEVGSVKKRGRPRKTDVEKVKVITTRTKRTKKQQQHQTLQTTDTAIKNEKDSEEEPSCSTAQPGAVEEPQIKTESSAEEQNYNELSAVADQFDDDAYAQDDYDDDDNYQKPSDESSNSDTESEDSNASDWVEDSERKEKFAVITKKERNTPKKYKKREKRLVEPKRMSREEIEARQAQQAEYDNIITKFFEKIRCPKCELLVHTFGEMRAHFRLDHNDDHGFVECCGRRFATRKFLAEHILVHYNPEHFKCKSCDKVCRDSTQLESHEQSHLPNPPSKYKKTFQCEKCSKTFSSKASFEHHMVAKHVPREEFKFECPECKKKWPSKAKLRKHMYCHDTNRQKICDQCGKTFACNSSMRKHVDAEHSHVKPEPQQCKICNTWYRNMSGLRTHMKFMHENIGGEHRCNICNKVSTNARALRRHIYLNHECERKYKCHMCEKAFKREQDLREHISVHTGEALYTCPNCPMTFSSSANMYKHRQRLHKAEYAAHKQQPMAVNIIKQAKSVPNTVRTKRRMIVESQTTQNVLQPPTANADLLNPQIVLTSQYNLTTNLTKMQN